MNDRDRLVPALSQWLSEGPDRGPEHGLKRALAATRSVDQRPAWTFPRRWLPRPLADLEVRAPRHAGAALLLILTLLALIALAVFVGTAPRPPRLPSAIGPSASRLIAFADAGAIHVARLDGTERRQISGVGNARSPVFSPDGTRVAYLATPSSDALTGDLLVTLSDGNGQPVDISQDRDVLAGDVPQFSWSPDGAEIAFTAVSQGVAGIHVAATDGTGVVAFSETGDAADLPVWSSDGESLGYRTIESDGVRRHLWTARVDGSARQELAAVVAPDSSLSAIRWDPLGPVGPATPLTYGLNAGFGTQTSAMIDLGFGHIYAPWSNGLGGFSDYGVPWAPDGRFVSILSATDGLIVADAQRSGPVYEGELQRLGPVADCWVDWSPDSSALYGGSPGGCDRLVAIPVGDPGATFTTPWSIDGTASWQPGTE